MSERDLKDSEIYRSRIKGWDWELLGFLLLLCVAFFAFFKTRATLANYGCAWVEQNSMNRTLDDGDALLMRLAGTGKQAQRGDVIIVNVQGYEECGNIDYLIKRLIATGGDKVRCQDGQVEIWKAEGDGWEVLNEPYAYYGENDEYKTHYDFGIYEVGEGEIFFLGDNRSGALSSVDSRYEEQFGSHLQDSLYKESDIYGIVSQNTIEYKGFWTGYFTVMRSIEEFFKSCFGI